jgi:hypothetical protein
VTLSRPDEGWLFFMISIQKATAQSSYDFVDVSYTVLVQRPDLVLLKMENGEGKEVFLIHSASCCLHKQNDSKGLPSPEITEEPLIH